MVMLSEEVGVGSHSWLLRGTAERRGSDGQCSRQRMTQSKIDSRPRQGESEQGWLFPDLPRAVAEFLPI
jgi:hypothetical protein